MNRRLSLRREISKLFDGRWKVGLCAALLVLGGLAGTAWGADSKELVLQRTTQARKACLSGDYQKGVDILTELFVESTDPLYIFNQGRCFEQNRRYEEAISRFEEYLRVTKKSKAKDREDVMEHIADCQAKLDKARAVAPAPLVVPPPAPAPETAQPVAASEPVAPMVEVTPSEPVSDGRGLRIAGIVVGSVGVAALATAITLNLKANSLAKDLEKPTGYDRGKLTDRDHYQTFGWISYGVGAACLAGGVVLYAVGLGRASSEVALVPAVAPEHAGLSLQGVF